jgi:hypothetical protein
MAKVFNEGLPGIFDYVIVTFILTVINVHTVKI